ncbi:hypothetical protein STRTUCAR8_04399 [Streptomyces turgidiscabies Car8]|uniref:Uncharacterized protein n=1 Tax=Streptomyces turgidiscabies (strain Car8) TaxID=698760 RepID=L7FGN3_STRT8|nr:hypothetical protein STRTUCAR8_04399 [Streptomyces turgidiscabies Car8]
MLGLPSDRRTYRGVAGSGASIANVLFSISSSAQRGPRHLVAWTS